MEAINPLKVELLRLLACETGRLWADNYNTIDAAWADCPRGDWMVWYLDRKIHRRYPDESKDMRKLVFVACQCVRLNIDLVEAGELRPIIAIETAERWALGDPSITLKMVEATSDAAYDHVVDISGKISQITGIADAVGTRLDTPGAPAAECAKLHAAFSAYYAGRIPSAAIYYASSSAVFANPNNPRAGEEMNKKCADIVRTYYPHGPISMLVRWKLYEKRGYWSQVHIRIDLPEKQVTKCGRWIPKAPYKIELGPPTHNFELCKHCDQGYQLTRLIEESHHENI